MSQIGRNAFIFSAALLLLAAIVLAQFILPWYDEIKIKEDHINSLQETLSEAQERTILFDTLSEQYRSLPQAQLNVIEKMVPQYTVEEIGLFFLALERLLQRSPLPPGVGYTVGTEVTQDSIVAIPIRFSFSELNYQSLLTFLSNIEGWDRSLRVTQLEIGQARGDTRSSDSIRAVIEMQALFYQ